MHAPFNAKADLIEKYRRKIDKSDPQHCPTYAAMIESMDVAVGTLLDTLDRLGIADKHDRRIHFGQWWQYVQHS